MTEELISFASKQDMLAKSKQFWNPDKTQFWIDSGVPLVIDRREGYFIFDVEGKRLIDVHLNGGTYNLGHRNPEVAAAVTAAMQRFDIGNHHFPSLARTALAEALISTAPDGLTTVMYGSGGGEAIDIALKSARHATKKRRIVSVAKAYHGHTAAAARRSTSRSRPPGTPPADARSSRSPRPTTGIPGWRWPPVTSGSPPCSWPTGRTSLPTCRSTTWPRWRTRCAAGTWPP